MRNRNLQWNEIVCQKCGSNRFKETGKSEFIYRFEHDNAREDFTILGMSLNARQLSTRAYRGIK